MKEYNIGDTVWWATGGTKEVRHKCPVCFGKVSVTVILGNGEHVETECDYCTKPYGSRGGSVVEWEWTTDVKQIVIEGKEVRENHEGRKVEYRHGSYILRDGIICDTKEEAEEARKSIAEKHHEEELERLQRGKEHNLKSYSWHVGYHQRCLKKAQAEIDYHSKKITYMKAKAKDLPTHPTSEISN